MTSSRAPAAALERMRRHVEALFTRDPRGRLLAVNDDAGGPAPRFFLGRTRAGSLWRFGTGLPPEVAQELERVCCEEPPLGDDVTREPAGLDEYLHILAQDAPVRKVWTGPSYAPATATRADSSGTHDVRRIDGSNLSLLRPHLADWLDVALTWQPMLVTVEGGMAVAVCASVRQTAEAHEAGVETAREYRRHGYGWAASARWLAETERAGVEPLYSTSWDNEPSQRLAAALGLELFGVDFHVT